MKPLFDEMLKGIKESFSDWEMLSSQFKGNVPLSMSLKINTPKGKYTIKNIQITFDAELDGTK